jgi:hypothetical protein
MSRSQMIDVSSVANLKRTESTLFDVRAYRLARVVEVLRNSNCPAILLYDPVNIRYATDTSKATLAQRVDVRG